MADRARMPLIKEQHKDNAIEVEKYKEEVARLRKSEVQEKQAERISNPRNRDPNDPTLCPYCGGEEGGEHHGQA